MNKTMLIGRLGADPETRFMPDGTQVTNIRLATDESFKNAKGEKVKKTEWHRICAFGKLAEICGDYLSKGRLVLFEGKNHTRAWEDKDGIKRYTTEIIANNMQMLDSPKKGDDESDMPAASDDSAPITTPEIPF